MKTNLFIAFAVLLSVKLSAQTVDCFIIDNPSTSSVDVYVVANGGDFLTQQWNDMVITLSVPIAGNDLGAASARPGNTGFGTLNSYSAQGWNLAKQPVGSSTPSFSSASKDYYVYAFAGLVATFTSNVFASGQDANLPESIPVYMCSIPKNGNAFADIDIYANSATETDPNVIANNGEFYVEINNLEFSGNVYKEDIIHFNNRLNEETTGLPGITPYPDVATWKGGSDATEEANQTDGSRSFSIYYGPVQKTILGSVASTTFRTETNIIVKPGGGFQTGTITKANPSDADSVIIEADATDYGQYIGPTFPGSIQQYTGTVEGWRNVAFPIVASDISVNKLNLGDAPIGLGASTSYHASSTPDNCGSFGGSINTVNVYEFPGSAGVAGAQGDHEWYGSGSTIGGNRGYSIFAGGTFFPTTGIFSVKGQLQDGTVSDYAYTHEAPHAVDATGASQSNYSWNTSCLPAPEEQTADRQANWDGWVLMANPFPCGLDVDAFSSDNGIDITNIRVWDRGKAFAINGGGGIDYQYVAKETGDIIPPMQAFYIKLGNPGDAESIIFSNSHRAFATDDFLKTNTAHEDIYLMAVNDQDSALNNIILDFEAGATDGYDKLYDSYVLSQPGNTRPQLGFHHTSPYIYSGTTHQVISPLYINTVDLYTLQGTYLLRFWSRTAGNYTFMLDHNRLNPAWKVYIEDTKIAPGVSVEITNQPYRFSYDKSDSPQRFILHYVHASVSIEEDIVEDWNIKGWFNDRGDLNIKFSGYSSLETTQMTVYDMAGKVLYEGEVNTGNVNSLQNDFVSGIYIIKAQNKYGDTRVIKVIKGG